VLRALVERRERVSRLLRLAAVAQDDFLEVDAAAVVSVRCGRRDTPSAARHERVLQRAVVIALVKGRTEVVTLEVREDVLRDEGLTGRQELGIRLAVVERHELRRRTRI
jgi:hypothetical protein